MKTRYVIGLLIVAAAAGVAAYITIWAGDPSVELGRKFGNVQNGTAYDRALIDTDKAGRVIVPEPIERPVGRRSPGARLGVTVDPAAGGNRVEVSLAKSLGFGGHVKEVIDIRSERHRYQVWVSPTAVDVQFGGLAPRFL